MMYVQCMLSCMHSVQSITLSTASIFTSYARVVTETELFSVSVFNLRFSVRFRFGFGFRSLDFQISSTKKIVFD